MKALLTAGILLAMTGMAFSGADISVTTSTYGGEYAPENCCAIWVEKDDGTFIKTLAAWGGDLYKWYLITWMAKAPSADYEPDAMTGASRSQHGTINVTWDLHDSVGDSVADGNYKIIVEMTEINDQGPLDTLLFTMDGAEKTVSADAQAPFSGFSATYPSGSGGTTVTPGPAPEPKTDDGGMCGGGSIMAMGLTFMVTGMHGGIRRRRKKHKTGSDA